MKVRDWAKGLNEKERSIYSRIMTLSENEKRMLWRLIKITTKDGVAIVKQRNRWIALLSHKELIVENSIYKGDGYCFKILPDAPYLMRRLKRYYQKG